MGYQVNHRFREIVAARVQDDVRIRPNQLVKDLCHETNRSELSDINFSQLDEILLWPRGYARAAWHATAAFDSIPIRYEASEVKRHLAYDDLHRAPLQAASAVVWAAPSGALIPRIASWNGTALVDVRAFGSSELNRLVADRKKTRGAGDIGKTGVPALTGVPAFAIDPLPGIRTLAQARGLVEQIHAVRQMVGRDAIAGALTVLAAAIQLDATPDTNGLNLMRRGVNPDALADTLTPPERVSMMRVLRDLVAQTGMSEQYTQLANCEELFGGLYRARDLAVDIALEADKDGGFRIESVSAVKAADKLTGFLLFYDSDISPEIPVVVDDALSRVGEPTLVVSAKPPFPASVDGIDHGGCLAVTVTDPARLERDWMGQGCGYATVTEYNGVTGRAVYTEGGSAQVVHVPLTHRAS